MNWTTLSLSDFDYLSRHLDTDGAFGSDCSLVNLFLLQKKYDIQTALAGGFLFRYYTGGRSRTGYGFPLALRSTAAAGDGAGGTQMTDSACVSGNAAVATTSAAAADSRVLAAGNAPTGAASSLREALALIVADAAEHGRDVRFCLCDAAQKDALAACLSAYFPQVRLSWHTDRDDSDYVYERAKLAALSGKTYHKKKNHVSRFLRAYEGAWEFRLLSLCHIDRDMISVAQQWLEEHFAAQDDGSGESAAAADASENAQTTAAPADSARTAATAADAVTAVAGAASTETVPAVSPASRSAGTTERARVAAESTAPAPAPSPSASAAPADARAHERRVLELELESIRTAVQNKAEFALEGGVLYVRGAPVAMTLASRINGRVLDVHFEKCLADAAANGAYAAINWCFATYCERFRYLNREEDMGVEGLRKAKLSYHPDLLVEKYYALEEESC